MWDWVLYFFIIRYIHIIVGVMWVGLLWYFNFVQVPSFAKMEAPARSNVVQVLVPRALFWFRWAALATILAGVAYIVGQGVMAADTASASVYFKSPRFYSIAIGGTLGIIMMLNVWLIIWPNQKKVIAATTATAKEGKPAPPDQPKWGRRAFLASRTNTLLSIPMLFFMAAAVHLGKLWT